MTTIIEALENALRMLEAQGIRSGDTYEDLALTISRLRNKYPKIAMETL